MPCGTDGAARMPNVLSLLVLGALQARYLGGNPGLDDRSCHQLLGVTCLMLTQDAEVPCRYWQEEPEKVESLMIRTFLEVTFHS